MFRMKRARCLSLALLLGLLVLPLPAMAGGFWEGAPAEGWAGWWEGLLGRLGLGHAGAEKTSPLIDPTGQPGPAGPTKTVQADSSYIDPDGKPGPAPGSNGQP